MKKYDNIVVGSGISGFTLALLLGLHGRKVLLLEKATTTGGSLSRFKRDGVPLDTGFHFTGGFAEDGVLTQMLEVLGIADAIQPDHITREEDNRFIIEETGSAYNMPVGYEAVISKMKEHFPGESAAIDEYYRLVQEVCSNTVLMDLRTITDTAIPVDEGFINLRDMLDSLTDNAELKTLMAGYSMCYGVAPQEVSFANHCRVAYSLYKSIARVKNGGDAFINAFHDRLSGLDVEIRCNTFITSCENIANRHVGSFILNTGEEVSAEHCVFTIHPRHILQVLPREHVSKAFVSRVEAFEPSVGFFSLFAEVEKSDGVEDFKPAIVSLFPSSDINALFDPACKRPLVMVKSRETDKSGKSRNIINAFELSYPSDVEKWADTKRGKRPDDYCAYKKEHIDSITERIFAQYPEYREGFKLLESASMLTFRDYLNNPYGCAYGIKQKMGQFSLFGKLPLRNIHAAGQSSVLPGLVGAMMSSFIVGRTLLGKDVFKDLVEQGLEKCHAELST